MTLVNSILNSIREETEARNILQGLERLNSLSPEAKSRWVWELMQNAKDCSSKERIKIRYVLSQVNATSQLIFEHNGEPFEVENLLAFIRMTSSKPLDGEEGNTGKFGTGFITTHVLSKTVTVSGLLRNQSGSRPFSLEINRDHNTVNSLKGELSSFYEKVDNINQTPPSSEYECSRFVYNLDDNSFNIAKNGLQDLERNCSFTLLANHSKIESVTIEYKTNQNDKKEVFRLKEFPVFGDIKFAKLDGFQNGLLFMQSKEAIIGITAVQENYTWILQKIKQDQSKLYKEFPLIGTEKFNCPVYIQHNKFEPSEPRDGIRTRKERENIPDKCADANREALKEYRDMMVSFIGQLSLGWFTVRNLHLLAESGLPENGRHYLGVEWFQREIQRQIRKHLSKFTIVETVNRALIKIPEAIFIDNQYCGDEFYSLLSRIRPNECPNEDSYKDWQDIIGQDQHEWSVAKVYGINELVNTIEKTFPPNNPDIIWINDLINYLHKISKSDVYSVYPNQLGELRQRYELSIDPGLDESLKKISQTLGRNIYAELLHNSIENNDSMQILNINIFVENINRRISNVELSQAKHEEIKAIFGLMCMSPEIETIEGQLWHTLCKEFLPNLVLEKCFSPIIKKAPVETVSWTIRYVCHLIQDLGNVEKLCRGHFNGNNQNFYKWFNAFLSFIFEKPKVNTTNFKIIPNQNGNLIKYGYDVFREKIGEECEDIFKDLYRDFVNEGDIRDLLVDNKIVCEFIKTIEPTSITKEIDNLFLLPESYDKVKDGGPYNKLFHELNDWCYKNKSKAKTLFPIFDSKKPQLYVIAFDPEKSRDIIDILNCGKPMQEILILTELKSNPKELKVIDKMIQDSGFDVVKSFFENSGILEYSQKHTSSDFQNFNFQHIDFRGFDFQEREFDFQEREFDFQEREFDFQESELGKPAEDALKESFRRYAPEYILSVTDHGKDFTIELPANAKKYYIEVKSILPSRSSVRMSRLQGKTASREWQRYALCVVTRPQGELSIDYFVENAKFVTDIGVSVKRCLEDDVRIEAEGGKLYISVNENVWQYKLNFHDFLGFLKNYF